MPAIRRAWFVDHSPGRGGYQYLAAPLPGTGGKFYFEATMTASGPGENYACIGIAGGTFNLTNAWDLDVNGTGVALANGAFWSIKNSTTTIGWGYPTRPPSYNVLDFSVGDKAGFAVDTKNSLLWARNATANAAAWYGDNSGAGEDPVAGTHGFDFVNPAGTPITGNIFVLAGGYWNAFLNPPSPVLTVNFGATSFQAAAPAGFSPWDNSGGSTLNPSDKDANLTLSNGNLTATRVNSGGGLSFARSLTYKGRT
jgi:hypothetical protein